MNSERVSTFSKLQKTLCSISTNRLLDTSNKNLSFKFSGAVNIRTTVIIPYSWFFEVLKFHGFRGFDRFMKFKPLKN